MNLNEFTKIIEFAIICEVDAQRFYTKASEHIADSYLKKLFLEFAEEEKNHQQLLKKILNNDNIQMQFGETRDYRVSETLDQPEVSDKMIPADAFALAMKNEEAAMKQYTSLAEGCKDTDMKRTFENLAAMERAHKLRMENAFVDIGYPEVW